MIVTYGICPRTDLCLVVAICVSTADGLSRCRFDDAAFGLWLADP